MIPSQLFVRRSFQTQKRHPGTRLNIRSGFYIVLAGLLFLLPLKWLLSWLVAASVHELFHIAVLKRCQKEIRSISIGLSGAVIETEPLDNRIEFWAALAGPLGSLSLLSVSRLFPYIAICGFVQFMFNMIPLFPLDGGRAVQCLISRVLPIRLIPVAFRLMQWSVILAIGILSLFAAFQLKLGLLPLLCFGMLIVKCRFRNCPCK